ncbi:MAG: response regulator, partial [Proteobacteria bacterium]
METEPFRILLVEDNDADRSYFRECLEEINDRPYTFLESPSGRDTLSLCRHFRPHCLILDYNLPQSNGLKVLEELQDEFQRPLYPVVMLTGKGSEKIAVNAMRLGAQDYIVKTEINPESLHRAIHHACDRFQLEKDLRIRTEELESANAQLRDLQSITSALSAGAHLADVARILINQVRISLKADTALVLRQPENGALEVLARSGYRETDFADPSGGAEVIAPVARALSEGKALVFTNHENTREAFPLVVEVEVLRKTVAFVAAPLRLNDKSLAALGLGFIQPRTLTPSELVYLDLMLRQCSEAVARANLYEEE